VRASVRPQATGSLIEGFGPSGRSDDEP
jgi:hypothetical protein